MVERQFNHEKLDVYQHSLEFVGWGHEMRKNINSRLAAVDHLDRASTSIPTNIVIGNSKESPRNRIRSFDDSYASMLECSACLDVLCIHASITPDEVEYGKCMLAKLVSMIIGLRRVQATRVKEERPEYSVESGDTNKFWFDHEQLDVFQLSLEFVRWFVDFSRSSDIPARHFGDLDRSSTGMPLNIAEGNGKFTIRNRCKFLGYAESHALCCAKDLDLLVAIKVVQPKVILSGKRMLHRIVSMDHGLKCSLRKRERDAQSLRPDQ